ncbi:unnamed protein product [Brassicogethes aeneus]|uniref:C2H2-type domain-containing protein n=1 Tax=Brassicogethes aeneus TaxID=1431903 RepID=A0A9P0AVS8_BRAAE|nr:unnamed protein product [Brassicogethes aeneus]
MEQIVVKKEPVDNFDGPSTSADQERLLTSGIAIKQEIKELDDGDKSMVYDESGVKEESEMSTDVENYVDEPELVEIKFEAEDKTFLDQGSEINDGDEESDNYSSRNEEKDEDEGVFETNIEMEYHGVECDDMSGNKKLFKCEICFKRYKSNSSLKTHLKIHDKTSYLKCNFCEYSAAKLWCLNTHIVTKHKSKIEGDNKIKINYKIHECSKCSYSTVYKSSYTRHINKCLKLENIKWYKCGVCYYKSTLQINVTNHAKSHNEIKEFKCLFCKYQTNAKQSLDNHILNKHSDCLNKDNTNLIT